MNRVPIKAVHHRSNQQQCQINTYRCRINRNINRYNNTSQRQLCFELRLTLRPYTVYSVSVGFCVRAHTELLAVCVGACLRLASYMRLGCQRFAPAQCASNQKPNNCSMRWISSVVQHIPMCTVLFAQDNSVFFSRHFSPLLFAIRFVCLETEKVKRPLFPHRHYIYFRFSDHNCVSQTCIHIFPKEPN